MYKYNSLVSNSISDLANLIRKRHVSPVEVIKETLDRIKLVDTNLNAFITINEKEALDAAKKREHELVLGKYRGPLHGIPIGLKDLIDMKNIRTTMGSKIYDNYFPTEDAHVVKQLKEAGAVIIGKLNTHQFAYGATGDRSYYGPVHNPYDLSRISGGSSSGSAASVSAYLCSGALGTDTGGSIRIPSSFCGIVGMKPTYGTISKRGVYPLAWSLDHVGPMTRNVEDNAILLNAIAEFDKNDMDSVYRNNEDFTRFIGKDIKDIRIGIPQQFYYDNLNIEIENAIQKTISCFKDLGAGIVPINISKIQEISDAYNTILCSEAYVIHNKNLEQHPNDWDDEVKSRLLTALDVKGFEYANARRLQQFAEIEFQNALSKVDALLTPTTKILPPKIEERQNTNNKVNDNHILQQITKLTSSTNLSGFPSLTLPCDFSSDDMPIGAQLIGKKFDEAILYKIGYALEQRLSLNLCKLEIE